MTASKSINNNFESSFLGLVEFEKAISLQSDLLLSVQKTKNSYVIGLEHPAVVTLGYRARVEEEISQDCVLPQVRISRGGLATIHAEGQLVIYPVLDLRHLNLGVRDYVLLLLEATQDLLLQHRVESNIDEKAIGLYTKTGKIAFCGIQVKSGITQHGLSLNVRNDLQLFSGIRSCGVANPIFDSLQSHGVNETLKDLYQQWAQIFKRRLSLQCSNVKPL